MRGQRLGVLVGVTAFAVIASSYGAVGAGVTARALEAAVVAAPPPGAAKAAPVPPKDQNLDRPGIQLRVPYYSEPEFLLTSVDDRWNVRNRPAGTIAAGFGHQDGASHDALMATARYPKRTAPDATFGALPPRWDLDPFDVSYFASDLGPEREHGVTFLDRSYYVTRYESGSVEIVGPVEDGLGRRVAFGSPAAGVTYVGAAVESDDGAADVFRALLVRSDGKIMRYQRTPSGVSITQAFDLGQGAVAAVGRTVSHFEDMPRGEGLDPVRAELGHSSATSILMVLRADGEFIPFRYADANSTTQLAPLSTQNATLKLGTVGVPQNTVLDFDFGCTWSPKELAAGVSATGFVASYLQCPSGGRFVNGVDRAAAGRIAVAVRSGGNDVHVYTTGDSVTEVSAGLHQVFRDSDAFTPCTYNGDFVPGSFDARVMAGVTYVACARRGDNLLNGMRVTTYTYPQSLSMVRKLAWPAPARQVTAQNLGRYFRTEFDEMAQPGPGEAWTTEKPTEITYDRFSNPVMQLQFPCADLLARPSRAGTSLDDCDPSTGTPTGDPTGDGSVSAAPPPNWMSYTIANYASRGPGNYELVVTTVPADQVPTDRTINAAGSTPPYGSGGYDRDNFTATVEVAPYLASDVGALNAGEDVDVATFDTYTSPSETRVAPLFLAQVPRNARTNLEIELTTTTPRLEKSPSLPVAVLQAPPTVGDLQQQDAFTPEFGISAGGGSGNTAGTSSALGAHIEGSVVATVGAGALGTNARAGGGIGFGVEWNRETESTVTQAIDVQRTEGYGGAFDDTTVVTRAFNEYVYDGVVLHDPTGISDGEPFEYRIPGEELVVSKPLSDLVETAPGLYGPQGIYATSIERITNGYTVGDPSSYPPGAASREPTSILESNGGPCIGGYNATTIPTDLGASLAAPIDPENQYVQANVVTPTGPNVVTSAPHSVSVGNEITESAAIDITESTTRSRLATKSLDYSLSAIGKFETEVDLGVSAKFEAELRVGLNGAYASSTGIEDSLAEGSSIVNTMGNIPFSAADVGSWIRDETYDWRMYFCKARLGPAGVNASVWVQGYVVDGYNGTGGLTSLSPARAVSPVGSAFVPGATGGTMTGVSTPCPTTPDPSQVEFRWSHPAGSMKRYAVEVFDSTTGEDATFEIAEWTEPTDFHDSVKRDPDDDRPGLADRVSCAAISSSQLPAGHLLRWRLVADGFAENQVTSAWAYFRPVGDEGPTATTVTLADARPVLEGGSARFTVTLDRVAGKPFAVRVATASKSAKAGKDFRARTVTLQFAADERTKSVAVRTLRDKLKEPKENFLVKVIRNDGLIVTGGTAVGLIKNRPSR